MLEKVRNPLVVGVKLCGNCNPQYSHKPLLDFCQTAFGAQIEWRYTSQGGDFDYVLVLNSCLSACANHAGLTGRYGKFVSRKPKDLSVDGPIPQRIAQLLRETIEGEASL